MRAGHYEPELFASYQRRAGTIDQTIGALFLNGVSTRKLRWIAKELLGTAVSASTVSSIAAVISEKELRQFQNKELLGVVAECQKRVNQLNPSPPALA